MAMLNQEMYMTFKLESSAFVHNGTIPSRYTCDNIDVSPPLTWSGAPTGTKTFALIVDDPDAPDPDAPKMTWVHWIVYNIPASTSGLPENIRTLPEGTQEGINDWKRTGYGGACPPIGRHRYFHKLYALDTILNLQGIPTKVELEKAMQGHVLAQAVIMGTYQRHTT
jgi:Raf kinase inhibitor-like YbhB/YbcL family protein